MKLLLDEMCPPALAEALRVSGIEARTVVDVGLAGRSGSDVLAAAEANGYVLLTENVADFARLAADHLTTGGHHPGVLIALSSRFSRRRAGISAIVSAIGAVVDNRGQRGPPGPALVPRGAARERAIAPVEVPISRMPNVVATALAKYGLPPAAGRLPDYRCAAAGGRHVAVGADERLPQAPPRWPR